MQPNKQKISDMTEQRLTDEQATRFDSRAQARELTRELLRNARRQICFFGANIDQVLFDDEETIAIISEFARNSRMTSVRFLVFDTQKNIVLSHRLLPLAQKLTSKIKIHIVSRKYQDIRKMFLLVDSDAYLLCPNQQIHTGQVSFDMARVRELQQEFDEIWTHSSPDINSRRLHI